MKYKQCVLHREHRGTVREDIAWIPEKYAKLGKVLTIEGVPGWKVTLATKLSIDYEKLALDERDYLITRKCSDI